MVYGNNFFILQNSLVLWPNRPEINGHEQRRRQYGPERHLRFALLVAQSKVADDQHVGIVPVARTSIGYNRVLIVTVIVDDAFHACPRVLDIVIVTPEITMLCYRGIVWLRKKNRQTSGIVEER